MTAEAAYQEFSESLSQLPILPSDSEYSQARKIWNGMIDKQPAIIAMCTNVNEIVKCVNFARKQGLLVSIRGGGHSVAGKSVCDNGLMIDLSKMKTVTVNAEEKTVIVQSGATIGELDNETQKFGLATPVGIVSKTGIAGLTLGGGYGYLGRTYGLTSDNLISAELVTARGEVIQTNETKNSDLFWALRGGGGNFGIVTSFKFKCHVVGPDIMVAKVFYPIEDAREVLQFYSEFSQNSPDELATSVFIANVPSVDPFPAVFQGKPAVFLLSCYSGDLETGKNVMKPIEHFGNPFLRVVVPTPFLEVQTTLDEGMPNGMRYYWKSHFLKTLSDKAIDVFVNETKNVPGSLTIVGFDPFGGAYNKVDQNATAFPQRSASYIFGIWAGWINPEEDEKIISWTRGLFDKLKPFSIGGTYSNFLDQDDDDKVNASFGSNYKQLQEIKNKYDPHNFFSINQNIKPKM